MKITYLNSCFAKYSLGNSIQKLVAQLSLVCCQPCLPYWSSVSQQPSSILRPNFILKELHFPLWINLEHTYGVSWVTCILLNDKVKNEKLPVRMSTLTLILMGYMVQEQGLLDQSIRESMMTMCGSSAHDSLAAAFVSCLVSHCLDFFFFFFFIGHHNLRSVLHRLLT